MTSFWGYLTEGILLLVLAFWWMVNISVSVIKSQHSGGQAKIMPSYPWPGTRIPIEIFYKLFISTLGLFGQMVYAGCSFHDKAGNFANMDSLLFLVVNATFLFHSLIDLLLWLRLPLIKGSNYASFAISFFSYALAMYYRAQDYHSASVTMMVTTFPAYALISISATLVLEYIWQAGTSTGIARAFLLQVYATWCWHSAFILHVHDAFPGSANNPAWNQTDHDNVAFIAAAFGFHICINVLLSALTFMIVALVMRVYYGIKFTNAQELVSAYGYTAVSTKDVNEDFRESEVKLLGAFATS